MLKILNPTILPGGTIIQISFTTTSSDPIILSPTDNSLSGFTFSVNAVEIQIAAIQLDGADSDSIQFIPNSAIFAGDDVTLTTSGSNLHNTSNAEGLQDVTNAMIINNSDILAVNTATQPTSLYWTYAQFLRRWGIKNVLVSSNKENKNTNPDYAAIQDSFDYAVEELHLSQKGGIVKVPFDFSFNNNVVSPTIARCGMIIAYADLYDVRGWEDKDKKGNKISKLLESSYLDLGYIRSGVKQLDITLAEGSDGTQIDMAAKVVTTRSVMQHEWLHSCYWRWCDGMPVFMW